MAKEKDQLIDSRVLESQCKKAVDALHQWASKKASKDAENELLPGKEPTIWLCVALKQSPSGMSFKPVRIPIVHPLVDPRTNSICLLTKDPQREYKDLLESHNIKFISRVVGISKLKGKFGPYEARRALLKENGLFLADQSIIPLLPKLLGVKWFEAKKQPIPVSMTRKDLKSELERAISSTYMNQNKGTAVSIKIGTLSQKPSQILANLKSAIPAVASHIKGGEGGWENIQSLGIKTNNSSHLPIWNCALNDSEGGRWAGLTALEDEDEEMEVEEEENEEEEQETEKPTKKGAQTSPVPPKGTKKRAAEDDDEDAQEIAKPKKKAKSQDSSGPQATPSIGDKSTKKTKLGPAAVAATPKPSEPTSAMTTTPAQTKKPKKKAGAAETTTATAAMEVDPSPSVPPTTEPKTKKKKGKQAEAETAVTEPIPPAEASTIPSQAQKPKKKKSRASEATAEELLEQAPEPVVNDAPKAEESKKMKKKKDRKSVSAEDAPPDEVTVPAPAADEVVSVSTKQSKKEKKRKSLSGADDKVEVEPVIEAEEKTVVSETSEEKGERKKRKKVKKGAVVPTSSGDEVQVEEIVVSVEKTPTLSKEELKQKKAAGGAGEKKKEKVVKSKGGKSAKDALLGKKAAQ